MEMSHLLRRTKKCCVKLFRKFTLTNNSLSSIKPSDTNNRKIKYKNYSRNRPKLASSPETSFEEYDSDDNRKDRRQSLSSSSPQQQQQKQHQRVSTNLKNYVRILNKNNQISQKSVNYRQRSIFDDEEIIFTENKLYVGPSPSPIAMTKVSPTTTMNGSQNLNLKQNSNKFESPTMKHGSKINTINHNLRDVECLFEKVNFKKKYPNFTQFSYNFESSNSPITNKRIDPWISFESSYDCDTFTKWDNNDTVKPSPEMNIELCDDIKCTKNEKWFNYNKEKVSSTTLESWIDDELFDNSFNEELEKRCSKFEQ